MQTNKQISTHMQTNKQTKTHKQGKKINTYKQISTHKQGNKHSCARAQINKQLLCILFLITINKYLEKYI